MGLLSEGSPLSWEETKKLADHVRCHGIKQFINLYKRHHNRQDAVLKWGDEVEYLIVKFDHEQQTAHLSLKAPKTLSVLREEENLNPNGVRCLWRPEYAAYMLEGTPGKPYGCLLAHFNVVESNMRLRREEASNLLEEDEVVMSLTNYPRLGCPGFADPPAIPTPTKGATRSLFFPDEAIFPGHPRFSTLTRNIRERRGEKVAINLPIFQDKQTPTPFVEDFSLLGDDGEAARASKPGHIYLDAMGFGMGCCCLQLTFQACNLKEARVLYDQLAPLCPIMLAITAASPIYRGMITDVDCRWNVIAGSVDCRTRGERGLEPLKSGERLIPKSRYDSIDSYLSVLGERYNDVPLVINEDLYNQLREGGIDHQLAQHVAHLFIRDPVSLFSEKVKQDDETESDHFENIQSTNWQTMRFKPPPPSSDIGWRVEFRPCEVQITDFENAAIVCFVVLLTRVILSFQLNFLIPISKVDENMQRAQKRDSVRTQRFWFRRDFTTPESPPGVAGAATTPPGEAEYTLMTIDEIFNGKGDEFPGLIAMINGYLSGMDVDADTHCTIQQYLRLIQRRASGETYTMARWIREFVTSHPDYQRNSVVSEKMNYDLLCAMRDIQTGQLSCPELLGPGFATKTRDSVPQVIVQAELCNDREK